MSPGSAYAASSLKPSSVDSLWTLSFFWAFSMDDTKLKRPGAQSCCTVPGSDLEKARDSAPSYFCRKLAKSFDVESSNGVAPGGMAPIASSIVGSTSCSEVELSAKLMPSTGVRLLANCLMVISPTTSPRRFASGPPLLPGLTAASVCTHSPGSGSPTRTAEKSPLVMVASPFKSRGYPMARRVSPGFMLDTSAKVAAGALSPGTLIRARSRMLLRTATLPRNSCPMLGWTETKVSPSTTCRLVITSPSPITNPDPTLPLVLTLTTLGNSLAAATASDDC